MRNKHATRVSLVRFRIVERGYDCKRAREWKNVVYSFNMADEHSVVLTPSAVKSLYKTKKRKINPEKWKDNERKVMKQSGRQYTSRNGTQRPPKPLPKEVME